MVKMFVLVCLAVLVSVTVWAVSHAHFVGVPQFSVIGETVFVSGKVAGLGNVSQIHVVVSGDAQCVNRGSNKPQAANKQSFNNDGDFPVQNGRANFQLTLDADFQPECSPPMSVQWSNLVVTVSAADGTFLSYP